MADLLPTNLTLKILITFRIDEYFPIFLSQMTCVISLKELKAG